MNLISALNGRSTQLFSLDEVRSERPPYLPEVIDRFLSRYGFVDRPDPRNAVDQGIKFVRGRLKKNDETISIESLDIYNDGIVVVCSNTTDADVVLDDAIEWGMQAFGMRQPIQMPPRTYMSWLVVDFEESAVASIVSKFSRIQNLIQSSFESAYGQRHSFELFRIAFNVDPKLLPPHTLTDYSIDRRGGVSYSEDRFFCGAPLQTKQHVEFLESFEKILAQ